MKNNNLTSSKNYKRYKKINYKRTGQEVYNIVDYTNINFNNQSDKKKQLIKTLINKNQFEGVLTNCL